MKRLHLASIALLAAFGVGCNIETTPSDEDSGEQTASVDLTDGFHLEPYGIGAGWYDYDSTTHAITPLSRIYRLAGEGVEVYFTIASYYDERGDSGYFTLRVRQGGDAQISRLALGANAKEAPVCVDMVDVQEVDCAEDAHHLVFRADLRVVPAAGFAVQNPSIYTNSHFATGSALTISQSTAGSLEALPEEWTRLADAKSRRGDQLLAGLDLGEATPVFAQATADMKLAAWSTSPQDDAHLRVQASCQPLSDSAAGQTSPDPNAAMEAAIEVAEGMTYVDLCGDGGPQVVDTSSVPPRGLWESADAYDLIVERFEGQTTLRVAPGHLIWSTASSDLDGTVAVPESLWE